MTKNIVICLDGTNNALHASINTNVVRLFELLDLSDPARQVAYYDPGVGTFSSAAAWSPPARALSRYAGLMFGAGMRQNLAEAYTFLMNAYAEGDQIYVFGFSRGAYTARALTGLMDVFGIFRPDSANLVGYAVAAYARQQRTDAESHAATVEYFAGLNRYAEDHARGERAHAPVHFVGLWDTVKAAGTLTRQLRWPFTRQLPHAKTIRHAISIDEARRPFAPYVINPPNPKHLFVEQHQDLLQVWFAGVHSDVGGMFASGTRLSDIPLKWMADEAAAAGLLLRPGRYRRLAALDGVDATGPVHANNPLWRLLGPGRRTVPTGALVHASVQDRVQAHPDYAKRLPAEHTFVDADWRTRRISGANGHPRGPVVDVLDGVRDM